MTRIQGPQIIPVRDFHNPDSTVVQQYGERSEISTEVRERYPDVETFPNAGEIVRTPVFGALDYFFVVRRVQVIPGVYAKSTPVMVRGDVIVAPGQESKNVAKISEIEFLPVYYATVLGA